MIPLLNTLNTALPQLPCCHPQPYACNCSVCLNVNFFGRGGTYQCIKKATYYVLNYGPCFASEIYSYLQESQVLERRYMGKSVKVLSLGCGFAPDLHALNRYIQNNQLPISIDYLGIDQSNHWQRARLPFPNGRFARADLTRPFSIADFELIFIVKLFSALLKNNLHAQFITELTNAINARNKDFVLTCIDVNSNNMGRDIFHRQIGHLFNYYAPFYLNVRNPHVEPGWLPVPWSNVVFNIPNNLLLTPSNVPSRVVFYEYWD